MVFPSLKSAETKLRIKPLEMVTFRGLSPQIMVRQPFRDIDRITFLASQLGSTHASNFSLSYSIFVSLEERKIGIFSHLYLSYGLQASKHATWMNSYSCYRSLYGELAKQGQIKGSLQKLRTQRFLLIAKLIR